MEKRNNRRFCRILIILIVVVSVSFCIYSLYVKNHTDKMNGTMDSQSSGDGYDATAGDYRQSEFLKLREDCNFDLESCDVVHLFSSDLSSFVIKKGKNSGIELDDPVITEHGEVVGRVTKLGKNWAVVSTVLEADVRIDGYVCENDILGLVAGDRKRRSEKLTKFTSLEDSIEIFVGDEVLTSGTDGIFPADLVIGTITDVHTESSGKIDYSLIKPACYHNDTPLDLVFVIKSFDVSPAEHYGYP